MTCDAAQLLIEEELDGVLSAERAEALRAHLRECAACARVREDLQRIDAALAGPEEYPVADVSWDAMVNEAVARGAPRPLRTGVRTVVVLAAAASLVLVCWLGWLRTPPSGGPPRQSTGAAIPTVRPGQTARMSPAAAAGPSVSPGNRGAPPSGAPHAGRARPVRRQPPSKRPPAVVAPGRSSAARADQLTPADVCLIYETALSFARDGRPTAGPLDLVSVARVRADSGDLPGAIEAYEAAVEASVRSPALTWVAQAPPDSDPVAAQNPSPPADVLVAWLAGGE